MAEFSPRPRPRKRPEGAPRRPTAGFTLVEVLVALAVLAIALAAVLRTVGQSIDLTVGLRDRTEARWAAEERATEILLRREWPGLQTTEGTMSFGEREWRWRQRVSATPLEDLRRVDIEITAPRSSQVLGRITLFVARP